MTPFNISISKTRLLPFFLILSLFFISFTLTFPSKSPAESSEEEKPFYTVRDFPLPKTLTLCGEAMPLNDPWVREMLDRELTIHVWNRAQVFMWLKRAGRYFPYLQKKLAQEGMPQDLKYLAVAESSLQLQIGSPKGARGPWQFMAGTASRYDLRTDRQMDERRDFEQSTQAALQYLHELKETFGTWATALAAYNCGEGLVKKEIAEQKEKDYYKLCLPEETERFIFRIASIKLIMENPGYYGYQVPEENIYQPIQSDTTRIDVKKPVHIVEFARTIGTNQKTIKNLNPDILGDYLPTGRYDLKTPLGTGRKVSEALIKYTVTQTGSLPDNPDTQYYIVQPGDTITGISKKTGVPILKLRQLNKIEGNLIKAGQRLRLL